jgi:hypothetical protein
MKNMKVEEGYMKACMKSLLPRALLFALSALLSFPLATFADEPGDEQTEPSSHAKLEDHRTDEINFDCNDTVRHQTLGDFLSDLDPAKPHTIRVSGSCNENITITGFNRLTLLAAPGASITDASGGTLPVINVFNTFTFDFEGFTVEGGIGSIACSEYSTCLFAGNTFQDSTTNGVTIMQSNANFHGDTIQNNPGRGLSALNGSLVHLTGVTVQNNAVFGVNVVSGSDLIVSNSTIQNNGGNGINVIVHSTLRISGSTIQENAGAGIFASSASTIWLENISGPGNTIVQNAKTGVRVADQSFAQFTPGNIVINNTGTDVFCAPQFPATRGALTSIGGGTTNCIEP